MAPMSPQYVAERLIRIHTEDSFARAIEEAAVAAALEKMGGKSAETVVLDDVQIEVSSADVTTIEGVSACLKVCVKIFGKRICKHVGVSI